MAVVRVRNVRVRMPHGLVPVSVAVLALGCRIVRVVVMTVVVSMGVLVLQRVVRVLVVV